MSGGFNGGKIDMEDRWKDSGIMWCPWVNERQGYIFFHHDGKQRFKHRYHDLIQKLSISKKNYNLLRKIKLYISFF